jgi:hypothetical protein
MNKSDIKNGMHVITNNGEEYVIIRGVEAQGQIKDDNTSDTIMVQLNGNGWMPFDEYDNDLCYHDPDNDDYDDYDDDDRCYDIKAVYAPLYYAWTFSSVYKKVFADKFTKLWERSAIKKMTKAEIETELGYEIEIVD